MVDQFLNSSEKKTVKISMLNGVFCRFMAEQHILYELKDYFTFPLTNISPYAKRGRLKYWNGKISLFNLKTNCLYNGNLPEAVKFLEAKGYKVEYQGFPKKDDFTVEEARKFIDSLKLPFEVNDHQFTAFYYAIKNKKQLIVSATGSGKSLIIYLIAVYLHKTQKKGLLIVPTINLVEQMYKDFKFYSKNNKIDVDVLVHRVYGGVSEKCSKFLTISTWQSIFKLPRDFFKDFDFVLGDEAHLFQAGSLTSIMKKLVNTNYRIGDTGTLQESKTHHKVLEGLFGPILQVTTSKELQEKGILSDLRIRCVLLEHGLDQPKPKSWSYQDEIEFIISSEKRNKFLVNLALSLDKNTLLLVNHVEKHGQVLYDMLQKLAGNRPVYFVHGGVNKDEREEVRLIVEKEKDAIIVASYGVFSTGVNIKNLHNLIFGYPVKSKIRNLQSIGRVLRVPDDGGVATLYDISDHIPISDDTLNHTFRHFISRVQIYDEEKFPYRMFKIPL